MDTISLESFLYVLWLLLLSVIVVLQYVKGKKRDKENRTIHEEYDVLRAEILDKDVLIQRLEQGKARLEGTVRLGIAEIEKITLKKNELKKECIWFKDIIKLSFTDAEKAAENVISDLFLKEEKYLEKIEFIENICPEFDTDFINRYKLLNRQFGELKDLLKDKDHEISRLKEWARKSN